MLEKKCDLVLYCMFGVWSSLNLSKTCITMLRYPKIHSICWMYCPYAVWTLQYIFWETTCQICSRLTTKKSWKGNCSNCLDCNEALHQIVLRWNERHNSTRYLAMVRLRHCTFVFYLDFKTLLRNTWSVNQYSPPSFTEHRCSRLSLNFQVRALLRITSANGLTSVKDRPVGRDWKPVTTPSHPLTTPQTQVTLVAYWIVYWRDVDPLFPQHVLSWW